MNTDRIARELKKIPLVLQKDALHWNKIILEGVDYIQSYANICAKIFKREFNVKKSNSLRKIGQIKRQTLRNIRQINKRRKELKESVRLLNIIQSRTQVMYERVRYWSNDELLQEYDLESSLAAGNMLELLRFLTERYNLEWEALEMVIRHLKNVASIDEAKMLVQIWLNSTHAEGQEFLSMLAELFQPTEQHQDASQQDAEYD
ncbi:uncharacterized protein LOC6586580 [Drosophila mojavensis]|uniref:Death domain-containing protein n=1 Tax=Drosophila mojavensis TaxID=7230 RepID=B4L9E7_DROMO|nr:uncharacterized protein LOC6586580 [Drosophila mojavensis]EDW17322.1 uncharacterized protein Dmoj_GI16568 [Drosophila mojavensis]